MFAGESIWAPDWVVSVSLMCGMVACGCGSWQAINNTLHISGRNMQFIQSSQIVGLFSQSCFRCMERRRQSAQIGPYSDFSFASGRSLPEKHGLFGRLPDWFGSGLVFQVASYCGLCLFGPIGRRFGVLSVAALYQTALLG